MPAPRSWAPELVSLEPLDSPRLHAAFPGLRGALRADAMGADLQDGLLRAGITFDECVPGKAQYLGAAGCSLRFDIAVRGPEGNPPLRLLVLGRLLEDDEAVERYQAEIASPAEAICPAERGRTRLAMTANGCDASAPGTRRGCSAITWSIGKTRTAASPPTGVRARTHANCQTQHPRPSRSLERFENIHAPSNLDSRDELIPG